MRHFYTSFLISVLGLALAYVWSGFAGVFVTGILAIMETSLSFDNAVVNAAVLRHMNTVWQKRFLTWGMVIAVFGMRLLFPLAIVAIVTALPLLDVTVMALEQPAEYARHLTSAHVQISSFGGMYLLLVFFSFILDRNKQLHWIGWLERRLVRLGKLESIEVVLALATLVTAQYYLPEEERLPGLLAGLFGVMLFVLVSSVAALFGDAEKVGQKTAAAGLVSFLYLQVLDASFSFDGVIGAFAISKDIVIIMLGLSIGAMFVRSLTVFLVRKGTLEDYLFLEHGAHYAIGALALLMMIGMIDHVSEVVTGLVGLGFILLSLWSSIRYKRRKA